MALDLAGIGNVGEFYSQHYLDSLFAGDVKNVLKRWAQTDKDGGAKAPPKRLAGLANGFFSAAALAAGNPDPEARLAPATDFHAHLLDALGYTREPMAASLDDDSVVPLLLEVRVGAERRLPGRVRSHDGHTGLPERATELPATPWRPDELVQVLHHAWR